MALILVIVARRLVGNKRDFTSQFAYRVYGIGRKAKTSLSELEGRIRGFQKVVLGFPFRGKGGTATFM